jgi:hypothetical protein
MGVAEMIDIGPVIPLLQDTSNTVTCLTGVAVSEEVFPNPSLQPRAKKLLVDLEGELLELIPPLEVFRLVIHGGSALVEGLEALVLGQLLKGAPLVRDDNVNHLREDLRGQLDGGLLKGVLEKTVLYGVQGLEQITNLSDGIGDRINGHEEARRSKRVHGLPHAYAVSGSPKKAA